MNYYEHHLGDYAKDTAHLTMLEHGAYRLLLDRYYSTEAGIPSDQAHRVARARSRDEKAAVDAVLAEFFTLTDGVWINKRAEEEINGAQVRINTAKANGKKGGRPKKNKSGSENETQEKPSGFSAGSENKTQSKAHQSPSTRHIKPEVETHASGTSTAATPAGAVCARLKSECRIVDVSPSHPKLIALLDAGLTDDEIVHAGHDAKAKGKGFSYALAIAEGRRRDAANVASLPPQQHRPKTITAADERAYTAAALTGKVPASMTVEQFVELRDVPKSEAHLLIEGESKHVA